MASAQMIAFGIVRPGFTVSSARLTISSNPMKAKNAKDAPKATARMSKE